MKELISQYGTAVLAATITGALLFLLVTLQTLSREGIGGGVGNLYDASVENSLTYDYSGKQAEQYLEKAGISLSTVDEFEVRAGEEFSLSDKVQGTDAMGERIKLQATKIVNEEGECFYGRDEDGESHICLEEPGIYTIWIAGTDANGTKKEGYVKVPVQPSGS